jgi:predicted transcriptional regulator
MSRTLKIGVGRPEGGARRFVEVWRAAAEGAVPDAEEQLVFEDLETLLRSLTPGRWRLLKTLRGSGPVSVRALARTLGRDYKNVHTDVKVLQTLGLIERVEEDRIVVPWEALIAELRLAA